MGTKRAIYIVTSERAYRRNDEQGVEIHTNKILNVGDTLIMDGLEWTVDEIVKDIDRGIGL